MIDVVIFTLNTGGKVLIMRNKKVNFHYTEEILSWSYSP